MARQSYDGVMLLYPIDCDMLSMKCRFKRLVMSLHITAVDSCVLCVSLSSLLPSALLAETREERGEESDSRNSNISSKESCVTLDLRPWTCGLWDWNLGRIRSLIIAAWIIGHEVVVQSPECSSYEG
jgi:hypothetical protein